MAFGKRKRDMPKYYAVRAGHRRGVYTTWPECQVQTAGYSGAVYKSFTSQSDAEAFVAGQNPKKDEGEPDRFYAVAVGTTPGIYTDWPSASAAIQGAKGPKYKKFESRAEALQFIREKGNLAAYKAVGLTVDAGNDEDEDEEEDEEEYEEEVLQVTESVPKRMKVADSRGSNGNSNINSNSNSNTCSTSNVTSNSTQEVIKVWTDGAAQGNGTPSAIAGVGVFFGPGDPRNISEPLRGEPQTNQRAELTAIMRAIQTVPASSHVLIYSDSNYSIKCLTEWFQNWRKNNWRTRAGPVMNKDLVQAILALIEAKEVQGGKTRFQWVKGHSNEPGNVAADRLAVDGCRRYY